MPMECVKLSALSGIDALGGAIQRKPSGPDLQLSSAGFRLGRVASSSAEKRGVPERAGEAGLIPDHAELFLRGVTAGAASLSSGEDAAWRPQGRLATE